MDTVTDIVSDGDVLCVCSSDEFFWQVSVTPFVVYSSVDENDKRLPSFPIPYPVSSHPMELTQR